MAEGAALAQATVEGRFDARIIQVGDFASLPETLARQKAGPNPGKRVILMS